MSTTHDTGSGTIKKFDPENIGIAVGILLLCALELEICLGGVKYPPPAAGKRRQKTAAGTRVNGTLRYVNVTLVLICFTVERMQPIRGAAVLQ